MSAPRPSRCQELMPVIAADTLQKQDIVCSLICKILYVSFNYDQGLQLKTKNYYAHGIDKHTQTLSCF